MSEAGLKLFARLREASPEIGSAVFGNDPLMGEVTLTGYSGDSMELQAQVGDRTEAFVLTREGRIVPLGGPVKPNQRAPAALVTSTEVRGSPSGPYIEVQPTRRGIPDKAVGPRRRLKYVGPPLE